MRYTVRYEKHFDRVHYCYCSKLTSAAIRPNAHSLANSQKPSISGNPLRAEELLTAHFNLAILEDQKDTDKSTDAPKSADNTQDAEP